MEAETLGLRYNGGVIPNPFRRAIRAALLLCAMAPLGLPARAAPRPLTLADVLARHRRAAESPAARADKGAHEIVYDVSAGGLSGTMTAYEVPPHRSRSEVALGPLAITTGNDGHVRWEQDGTGNVRILGGEELSEQKADTGFSLESYDPFKGGRHGKGDTSAVSLRPKRDKATGDYVLDVRPRGGTEQTVYLDPRTFLVRKYVERKGGIAATITILGYQTKFGAQIPSRLLMEYAGVPLVMEVTLKQATRLASIPASLFTPPKPPRDWAFLTSAQTPSTAHEASIPFTTEDNEITLHVTVNGHPLRLLLDSGAGGSFVTGQAAQAAGLTTAGSLPSLGYGGTSLTGLAAEATVEIGGAVRLSRETLHVIRDPNVAKLLSDRAQVDGALGYEVFSRFTVRIDYARRLVTLSDPDMTSPPAAPGSVSLPLKLEARVPTVQASVDGRAPARFLVDTGDAGGLNLYAQYARSSGLLPRPDDPRAQTRAGIGVGGVLTETITPGHTLALGTAGRGKTTVRDVSLATSTGPGISRLSARAGGIGNLVLGRFVATFDYARSRLTLTESNPPAPQAQATRRVPKKEGGARGASLPSSRFLPREGYAPEGITSYLALAPGVGSEGLSAARFFLAADTDIPAPDAAPLTLAGLLQRHLAALGGEAAITAIKNTRVTAAVTTGGIHGTITTIYAAPDKEFEEDKLGILDITQGYDGKAAWQSDTNGNVRPLAGEELKDLRVQLFFDTNSYVLPGRIKGTLTLRPGAEPGTGNYIVDALPEGGKKSTLFFDPHTFLIVKEQHLDDDIQVTTRYGDYRTVDGARFPFTTATTNGTARYDIIGVVTRVENNVALPPGLFAPPTGGRKFGFARPGQTSATVPFELDGGQIALSVRLNGQPARVFLDSGASGIALAQATATRLGLKSSGFLEARGYGGSTDLHPILVRKFEVPGAVTITDAAAIAIDLPDTLNAFFSRPVDGFVGYDLLAHYVVRVDYPRRTLTFTAPDAFRPAAGDGTALPLQLDNDIPSVEASVDALPPARFLLDTGDEAALRLYSPFAASSGLDKKYPRGALTAGGGIGGESRSRVTKIGSFSVAGLTLKQIPTDFSLDPKGGASLVTAGALGSRLLSRFVVTFDYPHGRVFFAPANGARAAFNTWTSGLTLMAARDPLGRSRVVVAQIQPRAPALRAGLSAFDEVLAIDGHRLSLLGLDGARRLLLPRPGARSHVLLVQSTIGTPRRITVALFDPLR